MSDSEDFDVNDALQASQRSQTREINHFANPAREETKLYKELDGSEKPIGAVVTVHVSFFFGKFQGKGDIVYNNEQYASIAQATPAMGQGPFTIDVLPERYSTGNEISISSAQIKKAVKQFEVNKKEEVGLNYPYIIGELNLRTNEIQLDMTSADYEQRELTNAEKNHRDTFWKKNRKREIKRISKERRKEKKKLTKKIIKTKTERRITENKVKEYKVNVFGKAKVRIRQDKETKETEIRIPKRATTKSRINKHTKKRRPIAYRKNGYDHVITMPGMTMNQILDFLEYVVRDYSAPDVDFASDNATWCSSGDGFCMLDYIAAKSNKNKLQIEQYLTNYQRDGGYMLKGLVDFAKEFKHNLYILDFELRLRIKDNDKKHTDNSHLPMYVYVNNNHVYAIENEVFQKIIQKVEHNTIVGQSLTTEPDWSIETIALDYQDNLQTICEELLIRDEPANIILFNCIDNHLNDIVGYIRSSYNYLPIDFRMTAKGHIVQFRFKNKWVLLNQDYKSITTLLQNIRYILPARLHKKYQFRNQNAVQLFNELLTDIPDISIKGTISHYNQQTFNILHGESNLKPPHYMDYKLSNARTCIPIDINGQHASILMDRKTPYPIYRMTDEPQPFDKQKHYKTNHLVTGRYYVESNQHNQITILGFTFGGFWIDSEALQYWIGEDVIMISNITKVLIPTYTIEPEHFQAIYQILNQCNCPPKLQKKIINFGIGSLGRHQNKLYRGILTSDANLVKYTEERYIPVEYTIDDGKLFMMYNLTKIDMYENNRAIYQSVIDYEYVTLHKMWKKSNFTDFYGFKTDCMYFVSTFKTVEKRRQFIQKLGMSGLLGGYKLEEAPYHTKKVALNMPTAWEHHRIADVKNYDYANNEADLHYFMREHIEKKECFAIFGPAGNGKSYLLKQYLKPMLPEKYCFTTLSHQALGQFKKEGFNAQVCASLFKPSMSQSQSRAYLARLYDCIVVDEMSMLTYSVMYQFYMMWKQYGTQIIFVGDPTCQLLQPDGTGLRYEKLRFFREMVQDAYSMEWTPLCRTPCEVLKDELEYIRKHRQPSGNLRHLMYQKFQDASIDVSAHNSSITTEELLLDYKNNTYLGESIKTYLAHNNKQVYSLNKHNKTRFMAKKNQEGLMFNNERFELLTDRTTEKAYFLQSMDDPSKEPFKCYKKRLFSVFRPATSYTIARAQGATINENLYIVPPISKQGKPYAMNWRDFYVACSRVTTIDQLWFIPNLLISSSDVYHTKKHVDITFGKNIGYIYALQRPICEIEDIDALGCLESDSEENTDDICNELGCLESDYEDEYELITTNQAENKRNDQLTTFYVGSTIDMERRFSEHKKNFGPHIKYQILKIVHFNDTNDLLRIEYDYLREFLEDLDCVALKNILGKSQIVSRLADIEKTKAIMTKSNLKPKTKKKKKPYLTKNKKGEPVAVCVKYDSKKAPKKFRIGKKRNEQQAWEEANAFVDNL